MRNICEELFRWIQFGTFAAIWIVLIALQNADLRIDWAAIKSIPDAVAIYAILYFIFVKWGWRVRILHPWLVPFPNLEGTWEGEVRSTWVNPATGSQIPAIAATLVIRQTFTSVSIVLLTGESRSFSVTAQISEDDESGVLNLSYAYTNRPRARVRFRSEIHDGAAILTVKGKGSLVLEGEYWTSRKTTGEMTFRRVSRDTTLPVVGDTL